MYQVYTPRICDFKSQSMVCKLKQTTVDNRRYSDTEYNEIDVHIGYNGQTNIGINKMT